MGIQNFSTALRLDATTDKILKNLIIESHFNKSQVIRISIRLLNELSEIKKQCGEIRLRTENGEKLLILLN